MKPKVQAVAAIIFRDGKFLFGKRSPDRKSAPGYWCPVSGKMLPGETEEEAVAREVKEELDVDVIPLKKVAEFDTHDQIATIHWWLVSLAPHSEPRINNHEHTELRWVSVGEMDRLDPAFEQDIELLRALGPILSRQSRT